LNSNQICSTDVSNDIKFIRNSKWNKEELLHNNREYLKSISNLSTVGFLIIDDSVIEKQTMPRKMESLGWHYSHSKGGLVYGHCFVSSHYRIGNLSIPYDIVFYKNKKVAKKEGVKFRSKQEIACELVDNFKSFYDEKLYVLTDSWYTSKNFIDKCKSLNKEVIGAVKSNRVFQFKENGQKHKLSIYVKNLRKSSFDEIILKDEAFKVRRIKVYLKGIGEVVILISKRVKDRSKKYILCTDMTLSNEEILQYYSYRWDIEVGYLYCKDRLGLGHYQMRKMKAIEKYCALIFIAFGLLESIRLLNNDDSIGQSRQYFKKKKKQEFIDQVIIFTKKGISKKDIYEFFDLVA
jgi:SRSO17 transposase